MINYEPLWKTMKRKNITTYTLINKYNFSSNTIHRLKHNMGSSTLLINDLCRILNCRVEDIMSYESYEPDDNEKSTQC